MAIMLYCVGNNNEEKSLFAYGSNTIVFNSFNAQLVETTDAEPVDTERRLDMISIVILPLLAMASLSLRERTNGVSDCTRNAFKQGWRTELRQATLMTLVSCQ